MLFANLSGVCPSVINTRVDEMVSNLLLTDIADEKVEIISEGFKRRLTLGMALIGSPILVVLDDPFAGVDPASRQMILQLLKKETSDSALLVCTQDVDIAEALATRIAVMHKGRFQTLGSLGDVMSLHGNGYTITL